MFTVNKMFAVLCIMGMALTYSCAKGTDSRLTESASRDVNAKLMDDICSGKYSSTLLSQQVFVSPTEFPGANVSASAAERAQRVYTQMGKEVAKKELTSKEQRVLSVRQVGEAVHDPYTIVNLVGAYYDKHGRLPVSALDLMKERMSSAENCSDLWAGFSSVQKAAFIDEFAHPLTGKVDYPLNSQDWTPFGISFRVLTPAESLERNKGDLTGYVSSSGLAHVCDLEYTIFGEEKDSILLRTFPVYFAPVDSSKTRDDNEEVALDWPGIGAGSANPCQSNPCANNPCSVNPCAAK